ncbi:MAG TPA: type III-B CRISPR-associated protein Cas10/Cmr2 [Trebonia sp.]|nr:type III-B CRISPR-associated protein Cas10/Cmr2 [Trebonia sp.]
MVALPGVQRFIAEARSTADLHAGSAIVSGLSAAMVQAVLNFQPTARLVLPSPTPGESGMPNRIVALAAAGAGRDLARHVAAAASAAWRDKVSAISPDAPGTAETPGFPQVQWVVADATAGEYQEQWKQASAGLAQRKRIRSFTFLPAEQARVCSVTGRWVALPEPPERAWNVRKDEALSVTAHVKRKFRRDARNGFPSTWSVATAPYRAAVIEQADQDASLRTAVADLRGYVTELLDSCTRQDREKIERSSGSPPGVPKSGDADLAWFRSVEGLWCVPSAWDPAGLRASYELAETPDPDTCHLVRLTAGELARMAAQAGLPPLTPYLAVIAQDADHMGERLAEFPDGTDPVDWHQEVSAALGQAARSQQKAVERPGAYGRVVYAGGDDLLALTPASTALSCVRDANAAFRNAMSGSLPDATASAAVVFFHASWPLQSAVTAVQSLLKEAKQAGRPGLGLSVLRRGGERSSLVMPWFDPADPQVPMADHVTELAASIGGADAGLSGRLASELERDRIALTTLSPEWLARELLRRNARHGGPAAGETLLSLSYEDAAGRRELPADAVAVARFLAAEAVASGAATEGGA